MTRAPIERVAVLICTFRRPMGLAQLLDSLQTHVTAAALDVVVVDNDPDASARTVVERHPLRATYVLEREPGIAAARNRGLLELTPNHQAAVFVDDDETVRDGWLDALIAALEEHDADVATGPVVTILPEGAPRWVRRGGFLQRPRRPNGSTLMTAPTSNTIVRTGWFADAHNRFDPAFSRSGGSDTDLFWRLRQQGAVIVWADDAVVSEAVPHSRATARWICRREFRGGVVMARIMLRDSPRLLVLAKGITRTVVGSVRLVLGTIVFLGPRASDAKVMLFGAGLIGGALGVLTDEYGRGPRPINGRGALVAAGPRSRRGRSAHAE